MPKVSTREAFKPISRLEEFQSHGALSARFHFDVPATPGLLPARFHKSLRQATYVVYSYDTPIGWYLLGLGWVVPDVKYSVTTSRHQHQVRLGAWDYSEQPLVQAVA